MVPSTNTTTGQAKVKPSQKGQSLLVHLTGLSAYQLFLQGRGPSSAVVQKGVSKAPKKLTSKATFRTMSHPRRGAVRASGTRSSVAGGSASLGSSTMTRNRRRIILSRWLGSQKSHLVKRPKRRRLRNHFKRYAQEFFGVRGLIDRLSAFQRLRNWFINHASAKKPSRRDPLAWQPLLQRLHQIRNPRPRCRSAPQQYMLEYPEEVDAAIADRYPGAAKLTNIQLMNTRYEVAKSQLGSKDPSLTEELEQRAAAQHEIALKEWDLILEDISAASDVSQYVLLTVSHFVNSPLLR